MNEISIKVCIALSVCLGVSGICIAFNSYKKRRQVFTRSVLNAYQWVPVGTVKSLWIYPVKSCRGISLPMYYVRKEGPMIGIFRDRSFVIVDRANNMVTARKNNNLVRIVPKLNHEDGSLELTYEDAEPQVLNIQLIEALGQPCVVTIWDEPVPGVDCGEEVADWLTEIIGAGHRLVYHRDRRSQRIVKEKPGFNYILKHDAALYSDKFAYLLMTTSSLNDISARVCENIPCENFRPNILLENDIAYQEDNFTFLLIGDISFRNVKHCDRCVFTTIHYKTGKRNLNYEPLRTLRKYRLSQNDHVHIGINLAIYDDSEEGELSVGDIIYASTRPRIGQ